VGEVLGVLLIGGPVGEGHGGSLNRHLCLPVQRLKTLLLRNPWFFVVLCVFTQVGVCPTMCFFLKILEVLKCLERWWFLEIAFSV